MNTLSIALALFAFVASLGVQWFALTTLWKRRLGEAQERHARHKKESADLLSAARQQVAELKHQLEGVRLVVKRTERQAAAEAPAARRVEAAEVKESLLFMLDEEDRRHRETAPTGFADTTIRFRGSNDLYSRERNA